VVDKGNAQKREKPARPTTPVVKKTDSQRSATAVSKSEKPKKPNAIKRWYRETMGELRKVTWPTRQDAWKLTKVVLVVMLLMSLGLGLLDFLFEKGIILIIQ